MWNYIYNLTILYKYVSQFLFNLFFWLMRSVAVTICLPVAVMLFIKLKFKQYSLTTGKFSNTFQYDLFYG